mmetsp:Transcript_19440/g.74632  ORF Transcript_19440/g.74632 Transcript_19440/m.74632 type:complete len:212 (+) Transcript_19440:843-1478(+)
MVDAEEAAVAARQHALAVCRVADAREVLRALRVLRSLRLAHGAAAGDVAPALDGRRLPAVVDAPEVEAAVERGAAELLAVGPVGERQHLRLVAVDVVNRLVGEDVPHAHRAVPGARCEHGARGVEGEARDGALVCLQHVQQLGGLHRPEEDLEAVHAAGAHDLAARVHGQRRELARLWRSEGAEVAVADQVVGPHRAVQAGAKHRVAAALG